MVRMVTVFVRGLEFYAHHGVPPQERVIGHRYRVDLEMVVGTEAAESDRVEDTVNYAEAARDVLEVAESGPYFTVERLGSVILDTLLARHPRIEAVTLTLEKRLPPAPIIAESTGVRISRRRSHD